MEYDGSPTSIWGSKAKGFSLILSCANQTFKHFKCIYHVETIKAFIKME